MKFWMWSRAVRQQFTCIAVKSMLNGVCIAARYVGRTVEVSVYVYERETIDWWRRSSCQMWKVSSRSSIDLMSTYIQEEKLH